MRGYVETDPRALWLALRPPRLRRRLRRFLYVASTGRCGTRFFGALLDLADNATIIHEPIPGGEHINGNACERFVQDKPGFLDMKVEDSRDLRKHVRMVRKSAHAVFGHTGNSMFPFMLALSRHFMSHGVDCHFIHLLREPEDCCASILRAEGPHGIGRRRDFGLRPRAFVTASEPAVIAADIWIGINEMIAWQTARIEQESPGSTRRVHIEDVTGPEQVAELCAWAGLHAPAREAVSDLLSNRGYGVRHSHQRRLATRGIPPVTDADRALIAARVAPHREVFGFAPIQDLSEGRGGETMGGPQST